MWKWLTSRFRSRAPVLQVPERFNRNSARVSALMSAEESGRWLLERMRQRLGFESYADKSVLDFGCGPRFSQAILNTGLPFGRYTGIDNYREMIEFLRDSVRDTRFSYQYLDAYHPLYNTSGRPLSTETTLPVGRDFDVVCMFSVITHQNPDDARNITTILRRHVAADGHLFFTCFLDDAIEAFEDRSPDRNLGFCFYNPEFLMALVERSGWRFVDRAPGEGPLIGHSFVFRPA